MGFNTVAFLLNDLMHTIKESPRTVAWALTHPPMSADGYESWARDVAAIARDYGEPPLHSQALEVLPTFHADVTKWLVAGRNNITELKHLRYGKTREGKRTVTLELPHWWRGPNNWVNCVFEWTGKDGKKYACTLLEDHTGNSHQCLCGLPFNLCKKHAPEGIR